nr:MAG TPA: hypothetical protein [Caudoviricetes sp.]
MAYIYNQYIRCRLNGKGTKGESIPVLRLEENTSNLMVFKFLMRVAKFLDHVHRIRVYQNHSTMRITGVDVQIKESFPLDSFECTIKTQSIKSLELDPSLDAKIHYKEVGNFEKLKKALKYGKDLIDGPVHKQVSESDKFRESLRDKEGNKKGFRQNGLRRDNTRHVKEPQYNHGRSKHVSQVKIIYK